MISLLASAAVDSGHSGVAHVRTGPELSDVALFVVAAVAVWLVRRAMRARFARRGRAEHPGTDRH